MSNQTTTLSEKIGTIRKMIDVFREKDGRLTAAARDKKATQTIYSPPANKRTEPEVWEDAGLITLYDPMTKATQFIQLSSPTERSVVGSAPGRPVFADAEARLAVLAGDACRYHVLVFSKGSQELKPYPALSKCEPSDSDFHIIGTSRTAFVLTIREPSTGAKRDGDTEGRRITLYKILNPADGKARICSATSGRRYS